jgi:hypothetical protein
LQLSAECRLTSSDLNGRKLAFGSEQAGDAPAKISPQKETILRHFTEIDVNLASSPHLPHPVA